MKEITSRAEMFELLMEGKPLVIDFYAPWCGPCRALMPRVEAMASEFVDQVHVVKCNADEAKELAAEMEISAIPCVKFVNLDGEVVDTSTGIVGEEDLRSRIQSLLS